MFCREQVARLAERAEDFRRAGVHVVIVGSGSPIAARQFAQERALPFELLTDTRLEAFKAIGARSGIRAVLSPWTLTNALRAVASGQVQGRTQGHPWQLGGVLVVRQGGELAWSYLSEVAGDHPDVGGVLEQVGGAGG